MNVVDKPWGREVIYALQPGKYCGKILLVNQGHRLSLQYHEHKDETIYVQHGRIIMQVGEETQEMGPGEVQHLPAGTVHRITALTQATLLEASTTELDDVVRLSDDYTRD